MATIPSTFRFWATIAVAGIIIGLTAYCGLLGANLRKARAEAERLADNQTALLQNLEEEVNRAGHLQATVNALTLRRDELESLIPRYERQLADMGIRLKEAEHVAEVATQMAANVTARRDTVREYVVAPGTPLDSTYVYSDPWLDARIHVKDNAADLALVVRDSITVVAHRPRKTCLFKRRGPTRYTAVPASPYTTISGLTFVVVTE